MYIVEIVKGDDVLGLGIIERGNIHTWTSPSASGYLYCSKFHNKEIAQKAANKFLSAYYKAKNITFKDHLTNGIQARVVSEYGAPVRGTKQDVPEKKKDKIRR